MATFRNGRRYRLKIRPAGSRSKVVIREYNFLETIAADVEPCDTHLFDGRPEAGTQTIPDDMILDSKDIGPAIWERS